MTNPTIVRALAAAGAVLLAAPAAAQRLGPTVPVEIFVGRQEFASELRVPDQDLAGARLGVDLADFFGIRGFYWRALNDDHNGVAPLQGYGAEAQLNLNSGRGITPFLVAGLGRVDFMEGFENEAGDPLGDQDAVILGGGARLDLGRVGVMAAARSYLFQAGDSLSDDLRSNLQLSAGLTFRLGRAGRRAPAAAAPRIVRETPDTVYVTREGEVRAERRGDDGQQFVTIPVPREGEIYLRYGPADSASGGRRPGREGAGVTTGELELMRRQVLADLEPMLRELMAAERLELRELVRDELQRIGAAGLTPEAEQRLLENLEARVALRVQERIGGTGTTVRPARRPGFSPRVEGWRAYLGGNLDRPRQFLLGGRLDLGPLSPRNPALSVVPELAIGGGDGGVSVLAAANLQYDFSALRLGGAPFQPYAYGGLGFLALTDPTAGRAKREAVLNLGYGASFPMPGRTDGPRLFLEHQGIDFFDLNRLLLGIRF